ncbi:MAG TPA: formyltetrahydrofolate deformylase [Acidothermaceae bacterium]
MQPTPATTDDRERFIVTFACPDQRGIVHRVSGLLASLGCNITESQQYGDPYTKRFFMRVAATAEERSPVIDDVRAGMASLAIDLGMVWDVHDASVRDRVLVLVSKQGHCLNDLLFRWRSGALPVEIVAVASNHPDLEPLARANDVPFHHLPITPETRAEQEAQILNLVHRARVDLVVLARYMQILSDDMCKRLEGRAINIHHSFLPGFKGAKPYHQAHERGVKLIGATAHYVTPDLDEGPIIEQEVARVDHTHTPEQLIAVGRDLENRALARAVQWHAERRILLNGARTVVFR